MLIDDSRVNQSIGEQIKEIRKKSGRYQWQVAADAEISETTLCTIEKGRFNIKIVDLIRIAKSLHTDPVEMVRRAIEEAEGW